jgi:uncharacterized membrane protein YagU involved in acid resistance
MTAMTVATGRPPASSTMIQIAFAGFIGAAIDAVYFSGSAILKGNSPVRVLQSIAGFWYGPKTVELGTLSAITGAATHLGLATIMAAGFWLLARRSEFLRNAPAAGGAAYGLLLYAAMYYVVMPLRWPSVYPRWDGWHSVLDIGVHVLIGIAFAFIYRAQAVRGSDLADADAD